MKPHKHAEIIKAWADGHTIEYQTPFGDWVTIGAYPEYAEPKWLENVEFRVKPQREIIWVVGPKSEFQMLGKYNLVEYRHLTTAKQIRGIENPKIAWLDEWWKHVYDPIDLLQTVIKMTR